MAGPPRSSYTPADARSETVTTPIFAIWLFIIGEPTTAAIGYRPYLLGW